MRKGGSTALTDVVEDVVDVVVGEEVVGAYVDSIIVEVDDDEGAYGLYVPDVLELVS